MPASSRPDDVLTVRQKHELLARHAARVANFNCDRLAPDDCCGQRPADPTVALQQAIRREYLVIKLLAGSGCAVDREKANAALGQLWDMAEEVLPAASRPAQPEVKDLREARNALRTLEEALSHYLTGRTASGAELPRTQGQASARRRRRITVEEANKIMMDAIAAEPDRMKWSAREWQVHVGSSLSTIHKTEMWRQGSKARARAKQERMPSNRGRRRPRHYHED